MDAVTNLTRPDGYRVGDRIAMTHEHSFYRDPRYPGKPHTWPQGAEGTVDNVYHPLPDAPTWVGITMDRPAAGSRKIRIVV